MAWNSPAFQTGWQVNTLNAPRNVPIAPIPVVLVGCGAVSRFFYSQALSELCDRRQLCVDTLVSPAQLDLHEVGRFFPRARQVSSIEQVEVTRSHLVIVASPPRFHAEHATYALERGASVLCEKPMAATITEAEAMIRSARDNGCLLAVGLYKRFFPACEAIRGILESCPLGELKRFSINEGGKFTWQAASDSYFKRSITPGGVLLDIGVHVADLVIWWLGEPVALTYEDDAMGGLEANCRVELEYPSGCRGEIRLSRDWPTTNSYDFFFERGFVRYKVNQADQLEIFVNGMPALLKGDLVAATTIADTPVEHGHIPTAAQCFTEQLRNVAAAMRGEQTLRVSGEEGIRSLRFVERCYEGKRLIDMPWLTLDECNEARRLADAVHEEASSI